MLLLCLSFAFPTHKSDFFEITIIHFLYILTIWRTFICREGILLANFTFESQKNAHDFRRYWFTATQQDEEHTVVVKYRDMEELEAKKAEGVKKNRLSSSLYKVALRADPDEFTSNFECHLIGPPSAFETVRRASLTPRCPSIPQPQTKAAIRFETAEDMELWMDLLNLALGGTQEDVVQVKQMQRNVRAFQLQEMELKRQEEERQIKEELLRQPATAQHGIHVCSGLSTLSITRLYSFSNKISSSFTHSLFDKLDFSSLVLLVHVLQVEHHISRKVQGPSRSPTSTRSNEKECSCNLHHKSGSAFSAPHQIIPLVLQDRFIYIMGTESVVYRIEDCLSVQVKPIREHPVDISNVFRLNFQNFAAFRNISLALSMNIPSSSVSIQPANKCLVCETGWVRC